MRISELSRRTGVSARSLRYYEQQGLFAAERLPNGYRNYGDDAVATVLTIRSLMDLGFPMDLVRTVLPCTGGTTDQDICGNVVEQVTRIRDEMAERVAQMAQTRDALTQYLQEEAPAAPPRAATAASARPRSPARRSSPPSATRSAPR